MGASVGQQGAGRGTILAVLGLLAAATTGYFFAVPGGSTGGIIFKEGTAAGSPAAGERVVYAKTTGIYEKNSAGTETLLAGGTQGGTTGSLTNAIVRATSANTLADTSLTESSGVVGFPDAGKIQFSSTGVATGTADVALKRESAQRLRITDAVSNTTADLTLNRLDTAGPIVGGSYVSGDGFVSGDSARSGDRYKSTWEIGWVPASDLSVSADTVLSRAAAGVLKVSTATGATGAGWIQDSAGRDYATADQTVDSTTLTADDTISLTLNAGRKYKFTLVYFFTPGDTVADGLKFDMAGGTATMTGFEARVRVVDNVGQDVSVTNSRMTALNTAVSLTGNQPATSFTMYVDGFAEVNAAGTLIPEFAKSADAGTGVVKKKYSQIEALDYP